RRAAGMADLVRRERDRAQLRGSVRLQLHEIEHKAALDLGGIRVERLHGRMEPVLEARRPRDAERLRPPAELAIENKERQAAEMIAMQMADDDQIDRVRIDAIALHADERGGAAIDQELRLARIDMKAGLQPAPGTEGIAATDELDSTLVHDRS